MLLIKASFIFLTIMRAITNFGKIQTFFTKYRPNKDPYCSKGLYYRLRSVNKDGGGKIGVPWTLYTPVDNAPLKLRLNISNNFMKFPTKKLSLFWNNLNLPGNNAVLLVFQKDPCWEKYRPNTDYRPNFGSFEKRLWQRCSWCIIVGSERSESPQHW